MYHHPKISDKQHYALPLSTANYNQRRHDSHQADLSKFTIFKKLFNFRKLTILKTI